MIISQVTAVPLTARFADYYGGADRVPTSVSHPASHFMEFPRTGQYSTLVVVHTSDGLTGYGEAWGLPLPEASALWTERVIAPALIGRDADDIDGIWRDLTDYFARIGHSTSVAMEAVSGIDLALWDLRGKRRGQSVAALLGGARRDGIDCYASPVKFGASEADMRAAARAFADEGFGGIKVKAGRGVARDLADIAAVRAEVGDTVRVLVDVNGGYTLTEATALAEGLAPLDIFWLEEPLPPTAFPDMAELRRRSPVPIAIGENEFTLHQFAQFLDAGCADFVTPNITRAGGITGCRALADLARERDAGFSLHGVGAGLMINASLHLLASLPESCLFEVNRFPNPLRDTLIRPVPTLAAGKLAVPAGAGLGGAVQAEVVERFGTAR